MVVGAPERPNDGGCGRGACGGYRRRVLLTAVLMPETALLVPGAAGVADVLADERSAVLDALRDLVRARPSHVVVVAAAPRSATLSGRLRPSLAAAGIGGDLSWPVAGASNLAGPGAPDVLGAPDPDAASTVAASTGTEVTDVAEVGPAVALLALEAAGWSGGTSVLLVGPEPDAPLTATRTLADLEVACEVGVVLVGSLSARRGPGAPLPEDDRAGAVDEALLRDLVDLGPEARARLDAFPARLAQDLAVSAWAPWRVLVGAVERSTPGWRGVLRLASVPLGATCAVILWSAA